MTLTLQLCPGPLEKQRLILQDGRPKFDCARCAKGTFLGRSSAGFVIDQLTQLRQLRVVSEPVLVRLYRVPVSIGAIENRFTLRTVSSMACVNSSPFLFTFG